MSKKIIGVTVGTPMHPDRIAERLQLDQMKAQLNKIQNDLEYKEIEIIEFINSVAGVHEIGSSIEQMKLSWILNKTPATQRLNIADLGEADREYTVPGSVTGNKTFTLTVTDERGATDSASTSITFLNGVYYGALDVSESYEDFSDMILRLNRELRSSKAFTFTANAGEGDRIVYAIPSRYGTPVFNVGGFEGGFSKLLTVEFTNASGYTEDYDLWASDNSGLGSTTVIVQ